MQWPISPKIQEIKVKQLRQKVHTTLIKYCIYTNLIYNNNNTYLHEPLYTRTHARIHTYERTHLRAHARTHTMCVYVCKVLFGGNEIRLTTLNTYFFVINHFGEFVVQVFHIFFAFFAFQIMLLLEFFISSFQLKLQTTTIDC